MYENSMELIYQAQNGDQEAMTKIVEENKGLVWSIVKRFSQRGYELDDLYQIGSLGFIKAVKKFDTNFEVRLSTYAVPYILGEIKRFIRDDGPVKVSRSIKELGTKIREAQKEFMKKNGKDIKIDELAKILKVSKEDIASALDSFRPVDSIYDVSFQGDEEGLSLIDKISSNENETNKLVDKICITELIEDLESREKQLILLRYYKGKTQSEVAKILGVTQVQVSRIEKKSFKFNEIKTSNVRGYKRRV